MNKRLILILLFFFALFTPLVFNSPSKIYEVFAGGPIAPTPFGPGPVVPPGGVSGGTGTGTTIPVQTPVAGKAFNGWNGSSFDTVTMPTPAPTPTPVPASTPVAGQAVTGFGAGVSSVTRESFQAPLPTATPTAGKAFSAWNGSSFDTIDIQTPLPTPTPVAGKALSSWNGSAFTTTDIQTPLPTPTAAPGKAFSAWNGASFDTIDIQTPLPTAAPTTNQFVIDWNGTSFDTGQVDWTDLSGIPNTITYLGNSFDLNTASDGTALSTSNGGTGCTSDCKVAKTVGTTNTMAGSYDFTGAQVFKILVNSGTIAAVSGNLYCDSADGKLHYACGGSPADTVLDDVSNAAIVTSMTVGSDYGIISQSAATKRILASNMEVGHADDIILASRANGDTYYDTGTATARLAAGTAGQVHQTNGAAAPSWVDPQQSMYTRSASSAFISDEFIWGGAIATDVTTNSLGTAGWNFGQSTSGKIKGISAILGHPGVVELETGSTGGTADISLGDTVNHLNIINAAEPFDMTWVVEPIFSSATVTNGTMRVGGAIQLSGNIIANPPTYGVYFEALAGDSTHNWYCVSMNNTSATRYDTTVAVTSSTWYTLRIVSTGTTISCYVNGVIKVSAQSLTNTNSFSPFAQSVSIGATTNDLNLDYFGMLFTGLSR